jgi:signal transduction histidine kinase
MASDARAEDSAPRTLAGRLHPALETTPERLTVLYLLLGFLALLFSDVLLAILLNDPLLWQLQAIKGAIEVLLTGALLYVLLRASRAPLQQLNAELTRQNEELSVLHRVLRHNLRNDLNVIEGNSELLVRTEESTRRTEIYDRIQRRVDRMLSYTTRAADIREVKERSDQYHTVDLAELLPSLIAAHPAVTDDVSVTLSVSDAVDVRVNPLFREAVAELITNAVRNADSDAVSLSITADSAAGEPGTVELTIADDGPGLPSFVHAVFEDGNYDQLVHLDGLGLWFVYWTITDMNGTFAIDDAGESGTTITLTLPRPDRARSTPPAA